MTSKEQARSLPGQILLQDGNQMTLTMVPLSAAFQISFHSSSCFPQVHSEMFKGYDSVMGPVHLCLDGKRIFPNRKGTGIL